MKIVSGVEVLEVGDKAIIEHDGLCDEVTIRALVHGGRADVEFASGAQLRCGIHHLLKPSHHLHRASDPDTAREAARAQIGSLTQNQMLVLTALVNAGNRGLIDHEHVDINGLWQDTAGKRRKELEEAGLCRDSGKRRKSPRNRDAAVHIATGTGIAVYNSARKRGVV